MAAAQQIKVWDIAVRVFHWSLVIAYVVAYASGEEEDQLHANAGYVVGGLILFRIVWGFIGTRHARFTDFIYRPRTTLDYAASLLRGKPQLYLGHNPLGGLMIMALLLSLAMAVWSGLEAYAGEGYGPLAATTASPSIIPSVLANERERQEDSHARRHNGDEFWEEAHELFANLTLLLVILHIAGVVIASFEHHENLVKAMFTGYKNDKLN